MSPLMKTIQFIFAAAMLFAMAACSKSSSEVSAADGTTGSLTRFITAGNYLYAVDNSSLKTYSIANPAAPVFKGSTNVGFAIQTIFPLNDKLFIGSANAMYIFSISNPEQPKLLSETQYIIRGKDPIVAFDSVAYTTVRTLNGTGGVLNVFNIKDINRPALIGQFLMDNPYGLGIKDSALYVCDGTAGLKMLNISKPYQPVSRGVFPIAEAVYDVIVSGEMLICYIQGGLAFINISNRFNPVLITKLKN